MTIDWKQLKADRAAGTPGPWQARYQGIDAKGSCDTFDGPVWGRIATAELLSDEDMDGRQWTAPGNDKANARRIARVPDLEAYALESREQLAEMTRRRDEWRKKAEGYDAVRHALREKVGAPWPPNLSRALWAGIAADEKKRADDAEARLEAAEAMASAARKYEEAESYAGETRSSADYDIAFEIWQEVDDAIKAWDAAQKGSDND